MQIVLGIFETTDSALSVIPNKLKNQQFHWWLLVYNTCEQNQGATKVTFIEEKIGSPQLLDIHKMLDIHNSVNICIYSQLGNGMSFCIAKCLHSKWRCQIWYWVENFVLVDSNPLLKIN